MFITTFNIFVASLDFATHASSGVRSISYILQQDLYPLLALPVLRCVLGFSVYLAHSCYI